MKLIFLTFLCLILLLSIRYVLYFEYHTQYRKGQIFHENVTLFSEPTFTSFSQYFHLGPLLIETERYPAYSYGQNLEIKGEIEEENFTDKNGKQRLQLVVRHPRIITKESNFFINTAAFLRSRIRNTFYRYLPSDEAGLLFGIVFGGGGEFSPQKKDMLRNSGVLHVVAASGMNVSMVAAFLIGFLSMFLRRRTALIIACIGVVYYALLSGFSPSVVRASLMAVIAFSAGILGRQSSGVIALFLTGFIMLIIHPETIFDVGFLLSFTSTLGILLIKPIFDKRGFLQRIEFISDDVLTTVSAQLGSVPVIVSVFGGYSYISVFVNFMILWTIPFLMILGGIAALCSIILPFVSVPFLYLSYPLLLYFETIIGYFGNIKILRVESFPIPLIIGYYLLLASLILYLKRKGKSK